MSSIEFQIRVLPLIFMSCMNYFTFAIHFVIVLDLVLVLTIAVLLGLS